jgi:hypothetical protein
MARRTGPDTCSFCGKHRDQTRRLIVGPHGVYICAECVNLCNEILAGDQRPTPTPGVAIPGRPLNREAGSWWGRIFGWWRADNLAELAAPRARALL